MTWQALASESYQNLDAWRDEQIKQLGWPGELVGMFLSAVNAARISQNRIEMQLALLQTVESVRMYAADHAGVLPKTLDELPVPAPIDPFTGKPFTYVLDEDTATIESSMILSVGTAWRRSLGGFIRLCNQFRRRPNCSAARLNVG